MNNKDFLKLASLNARLDKDAIRKGALRSVARENAIKRAVACAACTVVMAGICLSVVLLSPPETTKSAIQVKTTTKKGIITKTTVATTQIDSTTQIDITTQVNSTRTTEKTAVVATESTNKPTTKETLAKTKRETTQKKAKKKAKKTTEKIYKQTYSNTTVTYTQTTRTLPITVPMGDPNWYQTTSYPRGELNDKILYIEYDTYIEVMGYEGTDNTVVVPPSINGKPVTTIRDTFNSSNVIKYVFIPESVTHIDMGTFVIGSDVKISAPKGSYAYSYAAKGGFLNP